MKKTNNILLLSSFALLLIATAFEVNYLDYSSPIRHSDFKKISLKNFKGLKRINENLYGSNGFAFICTEMKVEKIKGNYLAVALFHPSRSYVFNDKTVGDKALLMHELYHFHIMEYHTRKLNAAIMRNKQTDIAKLLEKHKNEEELMQRQYDQETYHSYFVGKQLYWQIKIDSLLNT